MDQILHAGLPHCTAIGYPPHGETTHSTPRPGEIEDETVDAEADPSLGPEIAGRGCCLARRPARIWRPADDRDVCRNGQRVSAFGVRKDAQ